MEVLAGRCPLSTDMRVISKVASAPKPKWKHLTHRRLQTWPSDLVKDALIEGPLPPWLEDPVVSRLSSLPVSTSEGHIFSTSPHKRPNHVLVNEYPPGIGIMPHKVSRVDDTPVQPAHGCLGWGGLPFRSMYSQSRCKSLS